jgi:hypothetical protein
MSGAGEYDPDGAPSTADVARRLHEAPLEVIGQFADASNATLLVRLTDLDPRSLEHVAAELGREPTVDDLDPRDLAVYKPARGEAPLWDFPPGTLHRREVAAHEVSSVLGWGLVPITVLRAEGPFGVGSLQQFVPHDPERHYFTLIEEEDADLRRQLVAMVVFDLVIDNADRKGGHVLVAERIAAESGPVDEVPRSARFGGGRVQLVDHGVSFHVERKLRTVAWQFADEPVDLADRQALASLAGRLAQRLATPPLEPLLAPDEIERLVERADEVARLECFPRPTGPRPYPWPLV